MGDLLLIIPEGWYQLDWAYLTSAVPGLDFGYTMSLIQSQRWQTISELMHLAGELDPTLDIAEAKLIDDMYFLVRYSDA